MKNISSKQDRLKESADKVSENSLVTMTVNKWINQAVKTAREKGWHDEPHSDKHFIALIISELSEAMQADRSNRYALPFAESFVRQNIELECNFKKAFELTVKDSVEDELADTIIRCCDLLGLKGEWYVRGKCTLGNTNESFPEVFYHLAEELTDNYCSVKERICRTIDNVLAYCKMKDIDINKYVELKMSFNPTRPYRHGGKKY